MRGYMATTVDLTHSGIGDLPGRDKQGVYLVWSESPASSVTYTQISIHDSGERTLEDALLRIVGSGPTRVRAETYASEIYRAPLFAFMQREALKLRLRNVENLLKQVDGHQDYVEDVNKILREWGNGDSAYTDEQIRDFIKSLEPSEERVGALAGELKKELEAALPLLDILEADESPASQHSLTE